MPQEDPVATLSAFGRAAYSDLVTVAVVSLATTVAALPLVTAGAAVAAAVGVFDRVFVAERSGERLSERERFRLYRRLLRRNLRRGLPLSVLLVGPPLATLWYLDASFAAESGPLFLGGLVGLYCIVAGLLWAFRAASLFAALDAGAGVGADADVDFNAGDASGVDADVDDPLPGGTTVVMDAGHHLFAAPSFTVLHGAFLTGLVLLAAAFPVSIPLLLPGLLAVLEVVVFAERSGTGAETVVRAYQGRLGPEDEDQRGGSDGGIDR